MAPFGPLALLVTPRCVVCASPSRTLLCARCRAQLPWLPEPRCHRCGLPAPCAATGGGCPATGAAFAASWAPLAYEGPAAMIVRALKERGALAVAGPMAAMMVAGAPDRLLAAADAVVPVPADPLRVRVRGVDHAAVLARQVARRCGLPLARPLRRGRSSRQAGRDRRSRITSAAPVTAVAAVPPGAAVLLVDDVHTTGATLDRSARALRDAGGAIVTCLTFARTV